METGEENIKVNRKVINFLKKEADKKKERHREYVEKFKNSELIKH